VPPAQYLAALGPQDPIDYDLLGLLMEDLARPAPAAPGKAAPAGGGSTAVARAPAEARDAKPQGAAPGRPDKRPRGEVAAGAKGGSPAAANAGWQPAAKRAKAWLVGALASPGGTPLVAPPQPAEE
jgi:hypothetical protein